MLRPIHLWCSQLRKNPEYDSTVAEAIEYGKKLGSNIEEQVQAAFDRLLVLFGSEILKVVPGMVSMGVDAALSFDTDGSV